jgi:hypothetical protein
VFLTTEAPSYITTSEWELARTWRPSSIPRMSSDPAEFGRKQRSEERTFVRSRNVEATLAFALSEKLAHRGMLGLFSLRKGGNQSSVRSSIYL